MADIVFKTNGTPESTVLTVDGKEITKDEKVISINCSAYAPYVSQMSGNTIPGSVYVGYGIVKDGVVESRSVSNLDKDSCPNGVGQITSSDSVIRFIGQQIDNTISNLVDSILAKAKEQNVTLPTKEVLVARTIDSLKDKAADLGIEVK
jgi:hypothetical protein